MPLTLFLFPHDAALNPANLTVEMWVNADSHTNSDVYVAKVESAANTGYFFQITPTGQARFAIGNGAASDLVDSVDTLTTGTWHHLAASYDGSTIRL